MTKTKITMTSGPSPLVLGICLFLAVTMCSSAGVVFDIITNTKDVPPFLAVFWRLFLQNTVQFFPFIWSLHKEWRRDKDKKMTNFHGASLQLYVEGGLDLNDADKNSEQIEEDEHSPLLLPRYINSLALCTVSGIFLGIHFSMWVYSLRYTSLTHSMLWVSMGPICINGASWFFFSLGQRQCIISALGVISISIPIMRKPSSKETFGALAGIGGAVIMLIGVHKNAFVAEVTNVPGKHVIQSNHEPTLYGDASAFAGAAAVSAYLVIGQKLRSFLPIWLYVFPVVGSAALSSLVFALIDEEDPTTWRGYTEKSVFGFLSKEYFLYALYLAVGPGICGHTLLNILLKYVSPLVITTAMLTEPIIGSIIGYYLGLQSLPGTNTWIGGGLLMVGLVLVVVGESNVTSVDRNNEKASENLVKSNGYGSINSIPLDSNEE